MRFLRIVSALLLVAVSLIVVDARPAPAAPAASTAPAARDDFYLPPEPLPPGSAGDVIRFRPAAVPAAGVTGWQILYRSTTAQSAPTAASATVLVPTAAYPGERPLVAYVPGTQGWGDQCAPSKSIVAGTFNEQSSVNGLLALGYAVVVPDYPGLGTPGWHAYNVGIPSGFAVLDALRAATRLQPAGLSATAPMLVDGYSQGGGTAGWAAQLHGVYAPELPIRGVAAGGTPANLQAVAANINGSLFFGFLGGTALGFDAAYPHLDLFSYLTPYGRQALSFLGGLCVTEGLLLYAFQRLENYTVGGVDPIGLPQFAAVLNANNLGAARPAAPVLLYHGLFDEVIPWRVARTVQRQWCGLGSTVQMRSYLTEHVTTHSAARADVLAWLTARIAGTPATGC
jgi:hypothetical protein